MHDSNGSCIVQEIVGNFPIITGMSCTDYALYIGLVGLFAGSLFWLQVTK